MPASGARSDVVAAGRSRAGRRRRWSAGSAGTASVVTCSMASGSGVVRRAVAARGLPAAGGLASRSAGRPSSRRPAWCGVPPARLRAAEDGLAWPYPAAGTAAGADRDDLGVSHARLPRGPGMIGGQQVGEPGDGPLGDPRGRGHRGREVGERLGRGVVGLEAELGAHPRRVDAAAEGQEAAAARARSRPAAPGAAPSRAGRRRSRAAAASRAAGGARPATASRCRRRRR